LNKLLFRNYSPALFVSVKSEGGHQRRLGWQFDQFYSFLTKGFCGLMMRKSLPISRDYSAMIYRLEWVMLISPDFLNCSF